jgi:NAD+ synthase (glutamine-hydrolysing)
VFTTAYMGTENSSAETRQRAAMLAREIGAHHLDLNIDTIVAAVTALFAAVTGRKPAFKVCSVMTFCCLGCGFCMPAPIAH